MRFNTDYQTRSEYFKTTLNQQKQVKVKECNQLVLGTAIDFMYGANIPSRLALADAKVFWLWLTCTRWRISRTLWLP